MKEIIKIEIRGSSGYTPMEYVHKDKFTLTEGSASYEYIPYLKDSDKARKWSYETDGREFREQFDHIRSIIMPILKGAPDYEIEDAGSVAFTISYSDGTEEVFRFDCLTGYFDELFNELKAFVPPVEPVPAVLWTIDDEEEDMTWNAR